MKIDKVIRKLQKQFPGIKGICRGEDMGWVKGSILLGDAGEGGEIDGELAASYWAEDPSEEVYVLGIHKELDEFLKQCGMFAEWHDAGTLLAYRI